MKKVHYLIIGGGVAGLSALEKLKKARKHVLLIEKSSQCGGLVNSSREHEILHEVGPTAFLKSYKHTYQFVKDIGLESEIITNIPGNDKRYILRDGKIHAIPEGPISFFKSPLFSSKAKLTLALEPFKFKKSNSLETVAEFGRRRFGDEVASTVLDAMVSGVCAGDYNKIEIASLFPKINVIEDKFKSFLLFLLLFKLKTTETKNNKSITFRSLRNGMGEIARAMESRYPESIMMNTEALHISRNECGYLVKTSQGEFQTEKIVLACDAITASKLLLTVEFELAELLEKIPYTSIVTAMMSYKKAHIQHPMDGFGFLVPRSQNVRILGGLFLSTLFPNRAPLDVATIKVYIGGAHDKEALKLSDDQILALINKEMNPLLGIIEAPISYKIQRIEKAIPQYNLGHQELKEKIYTILNEQDSIFLVGNYLEGISVNEAIKSSEVLGYK